MVMLKSTPRVTAVLTGVALALMLNGMARADETTSNTKRISKAEYKQQIHTAKLNYKAAKAKCDEMSGNAKDVCVEEAKAAKTKAETDAKAQRKSTTVRAEANEDKRDADYKVAKEKCDALSGDAKDHCIADAKAKYGE